MICQTRKIILLFIILLIFLLSFVSSVIAFKGLTHSLINKYIAQSAFDKFTLDIYLKEQLGMKKGYDEQFDSKKAHELISDGGELEDSHIILRYLNHFHDPISNTGVLGSKSALEWALMETGTQLAGDYSWWDARNYYFKALTATDKDAREPNFAKTFRALGQVMHLVQDVSVTKHV